MSMLRRSPLLQYALGDRVGQGTEALQLAHDGVGIALLGGEQVTTPHADRVDAARTGT
jgi:hypothetical protein